MEVMSASPLPQDTCISAAPGNAWALTSECMDSSGLATKGRGKCGPIPKATTASGQLSLPPSAGAPASKGKCKGKGKGPALPKSAALQVSPLAKATGTLQDPAVAAGDAGGQTSSHPSCLQHTSGTHEEAARNGIQGHVQVSAAEARTGASLDLPGVAAAPSQASCGAMQLCLEFNSSVTELGVCIEQVSSVLNSPELDEESKLALGSALQQLVVCASEIADRLEV